MSWQVASFAGLAVVLVVGFAWYERTRPSARVVALVAALAALAVAGRLVLAPVPNVVGTTDVALLTGYALGGAPGFAVGALAAPISNIWLGQGPWTVWQMGGWGLAGLAGAGLAFAFGRHLGRLGLACACAAMALVYGALLDLSVMVTYGGEQSLDRYLALSARGVPFNVAHALGNFGIAFVAGPALVAMIERYRSRLEFRWHPAGVLPLVLAAIVLAGLGPPADDSRAAGAASARAWLERARENSGGYAATPGLGASVQMTGWAMLGLEAAGRNPLDVGPRRRTPGRLPGGQRPAHQLAERARAGDPGPGGRRAGLDPVRGAEPGHRPAAQAIRRRLVAGAGEPDRVRGPGVAGGALVERRLPGRRVAAGGPER